MKLNNSGRLEVNCSMEFYLGSCPEKNPCLIFWMEAQSSLTLRSDDMKPGLLPHMLEMFSDNDGLKSFKLCLDGKKVNISSISLLGGVVLFGFEDKPTAQDRKDRLKKEESMIYLINNVLKKFFEKDLLDLNGCPDKYSNDCTELLGLMKDVMRLLNLRISYLRPLRVKKSITLQKLKEISGSNWRKS